MTKKLQNVSTQIFSSIVTRSVQVSTLVTQRFAHTGAPTRLMMTSDVYTTSIAEHPQEPALARALLHQAFFTKKDLE